MEAVMRQARGVIAPWRFTFLIKLLALAALVALADRLFYLPDDAGATLGLFVLALLASLVALRPEVRRSGPALAAVGAASWFGLWLVDDPGPLALLLAWASLGMVVLLPRAERFGSGLRWVQRLLLHSLATPFRPLLDFKRLARARKRRPARISLSSTASTLVLPLLGTGLFVALFSAANPIVGNLVGGIDPFWFLSGWSLLRLAFWFLIGALVWRLLRPRLWLPGERHAPTIDWLDLPGISTASVIISLIAFNILFAMQNGLDLAFLWSGAPLPDGMTLAEYAHRGAYPLIATALLAGGFVLVTTRAGSPMAESRAIQRLVYLWLAQNIFLVSSTMLRTIDYIEVYQLTELRIQALVWMTLVALGLLLICLRLAFGKTSVWLINANMAAATLVLSGSVAIDYDRIAAGWNVRHAREVGGRGAAIDLCYLDTVGSSALLPLVELETRSLSPELSSRVAVMRNRAMFQLEYQHAGDGWTWRGSRRLEAARKLVAQHRLPRITVVESDCNGRLLDPNQPAPPAPAPRPLTAAKGR
jgi:hypothetical protein